MEGPIKQFNPYDDNGGSIVAIAGTDYAVIGADTRLSGDFVINTRSQKKLFELSSKAVLGSGGCWCDSLALTRVLNARIAMYKYENNREISTVAVAQMLTTLLYFKRFFPYFVYSIIAGLDDNGEGCVYAYDSVGHCEKSRYAARGNAGTLLQPLLDNQIGLKNMQDAIEVPLKKNRALKLLKDAFTSAGERDIYTGDRVLIRMITADGVTEEEFELRKD